MVAEILNEFLYDVEEIMLIPACDREFEVEVDGKLVFSKNQIGRHGNDGEIMNNIRDIIKI